MAVAAGLVSKLFLSKWLGGQPQWDSRGSGRNVAVGAVVARQRVNSATDAAGSVCRFSILAALSQIWRHQCCTCATKLRHAGSDSRWQIRCHLRLSAERARGRGRGRRRQRRLPPHTATCVSLPATSDASRRHDTTDPVDSLRKVVNGASCQQNLHGHIDRLQQGIRVYRGNGVPKEANEAPAAITNSVTLSRRLPGAGWPRISATVRCLRSAPGSSSSKTPVRQTAADNRATVLTGSMSVTDASRSAFVPRRAPQALHR